jgi:hypothetical protein
MSSTKKLKTSFDSNLGSISKSSSYKAPPNFAKMHNRQFSSSKSITDKVERVIL